MCLPTCLDITWSSAAQFLVWLQSCLSGVGLSVRLLPYGAVDPIFAPKPVTASPGAALAEAWGLQVSPQPDGLMLRYQHPYCRARTATHSYHMHAARYLGAWCLSYLNYLPAAAQRGDGRFTKEPAGRWCGAGRHAGETRLQSAHQPAQPRPNPRPKGAAAS